MGLRSPNHERDLTSTARAGCHQRLPLTAASVQRGRAAAVAPGGHRVVESSRGVCISLIILVHDRKGMRSKVINMAAVIGELGDEAAKPKKHFKTAVVIAPPVLLALIIAALWVFGGLPNPFGLTKHTSVGSPEKDAKDVGHSASIIIELPELVANLNVPGRRPAYIKLKASVELGKAEDQVVFAAIQPHVMDLFQTYLRELHPEELRGSAGTYRLREELINRINVSIAPGKIVNLLFSELLIQ